MYNDRARDEIDLVDIWLVLINRWKILAAALVCGVVISAAYAVSRPPVYDYRTLIEIGTQVIKDEVQLIELPESLNAKIREGYLPIALREFYERHPEVKEAFKIETSVPKDANVVMMEHRGVSDVGELVREIHERLVQLVLQDHGRIVSLIRSETQISLEQTRRQLAKLEEDEALLEVALPRLENEHANRIAMLDENIALARAELRRLDDAERLVAEQLENLESLVANGYANRERAIRQDGEATRAMTLLLITDGLQRNQALVSELRERRTVAIPNSRSRYTQKIDELQKEKLILSDRLANERDQFNQRIANVQREQEQVRGRLAGWELRLENLRETRPISVAAASVWPVGPGKALIVAVGTVLGVFLGFFAVFFVNLLHHARQRQAGSAETIVQESRRVELHEVARPGTGEPSKGREILVG